MLSKGCVRVIQSRPNVSARELVCACMAWLRSQQFPILRAFLRQAAIWSVMRGPLRGHRWRTAAACVWLQVQIKKQLRLEASLPDCNACAYGLHRIASPHSPSFDHDAAYCPWFSTS